jgi:hypothetical protein
LKRSRLARRSRLKAKKGLKRGGRLRCKAKLKAKKRIKWVNKERRAKLEARDYGPKAVWARTLACHITRRPAPSVAAHPDTRGSGSHSEAIMPFNALVEIDWHGLVDAQFEAKYGWSKDAVRDDAPFYEKEWQAMVGDGRAAPWIAQWEEETGLVWAEMEPART